MTVEQVLDKEFELVMEDIKQAYIDKGMKATGKTSDSIENVSKGETGKLIADQNIEALEKGRSPTSKGNSGGETLVDIIKKWIVDKGVVNRIRGNITISSLAFLIARKIHKEGWNRSEHGGLNLISDVFTDKRIQSIINKVGESATISFVTRIENEFKTIKI